MNDIKILEENSIKRKIHMIRGLQVIIDSDLAGLYEVKTKRLNEQIKRNIERFPKDFMFRLNKKEKNELVAKCDQLYMLKYSTNFPYAFTEQGVAMLSGILRSKKAIEINIQIMRAFILMKKMFHSDTEIFNRIGRLESKNIEYDENFKVLFDALDKDRLKKEKGIFFDGQVFDAYRFILDIIRSARESIVLIDNYIDDSVLILFSRREIGVRVTIFTKKISKQLSLDLEKYNSQYEKIKILEFEKSHDRFLIIDDKEVYHIGASLKDLGKKWFAFSKFDRDCLRF